MSHGQIKHLTVWNIAQLLNVWTRSRSRTTNPSGPDHDVLIGYSGIDILVFNDIYECNRWGSLSPLVPPCLEKVVHHILSLPFRLTWVGICALKMFCSVSMTMPGAVVAKCGLWLSATGLGTPGWLALVLTSEPFPKAWIAFSRRQKQYGQTLCFQGHEWQFNNVTLFLPTGSQIEKLCFYISSHLYFASVLSGSLKYGYYIIMHGWGCNYVKWGQFSLSQRDSSRCASTVTCNRFVCEENHLISNVSKTQEMALDFRAIVHPKPSPRSPLTSIWEVHIDDTHETNVLLTETGVEQKPLLLFYKSVLESVLRCRTLVWYSNLSALLKAQTAPLAQAALKLVGITAYPSVCFF